MIPSMVKIPMIVRKSITLKSNYRNTKEIAAFADEMRLLMDLNDDDGRRTNKCVQEGKLPDVRIATSEEQEKNWVTETVKRWKRPGSSVGIILPTKAMVAEYKNMLSEYAPVVMNRELKSFTTKEGLFISHYHAIKGLEFDRIIMPACVSDSFMSTADMQEIESEEERKKHLATLIYTACTRAKERLLITGVGKLVEQLPLCNGLFLSENPGYQIANHAHIQHGAEWA